MLRKSLEVLILMAVVAVLARWMMAPQESPVPSPGPTQAPEILLLERLGPMGAPPIIVVLVYTAMNTLPFGLLAGWITYRVTANRTIKVAHIVLVAAVGGGACTVARLIHVFHSHSIQPDAAFFGVWLGISVGLGYRRQQQQLTIWEDRGER